MQKTVRRKRAAAVAEGRRRHRVQLLRSYRAGELPDVQSVTLQAFLAPLGTNRTRQSVYLSLCPSGLVASTVDSILSSLLFFISCQQITRVLILLSSSAICLTAVCHVMLVGFQDLHSADCQPKICAHKKLKDCWGVLCSHRISAFADRCAHYLSGVLASRDDVIAIELLGSMWGGTVARMKGLGSSGAPDDSPAVAVLPDRLPVLRASLVACVLQGGHASQLIHVLQVGSVLDCRNTRSSRL